MKQKQKRKHLESTLCLPAAKMSRGNLDLQEDTLQCKQKVLAPTPDEKTGDTSSSPSVYYSCFSYQEKLILAECQEFQADALKTHVVVRAQSPAAGEGSSVSEYFTCVSNSSQLLLLAKNEVHKPQQYVPCVETSEMPLKQKVKDQISSHSARDHFPVDLENKPSTFSAPKQKERIVKVFYMHVQMKRGVAVLQDTKQGSEPPTKKTKLENIMFPEKVRTVVHFPHVLTHELLSESEPSLHSDTEEEREETDSPAESESVAMEETSRAQTPEWLVTLDHGFRCMACCRVFSSLEALQYHVENGVNEGFSCHAFHLALAWLKSKGDKKKMRKNREPKTNTCDPNEEVRSGTNTSISS